MQNAPTEPCRLQVTPSCPLVAPLFLFPGVHLSFTAVLTSDHRNRELVRICASEQIQSKGSNRKMAIEKSKIDYKTEK